ncbi:MULTISPECIES: hypothetical protein [Klebsiella]|uniref:hypothetical protein n=1 Tax=Klebsiella TaxID=570 RepID=UPI0010CAD26E|nr:MULTISPECIES: hypothetical protein [Klebsiella]MDU2151550.1 hypothetical protein [Weissella confusa]MDU2878747.1 hypothetical protein [Enterobacter sp.]HBT2836112.1 hypothetical protein [Klebsiella pneumoniae]MBZ7650927.1 hypothetical protein [Klebsiella grimontii]MDU2426537.1 hypothetical protein [Klebsiella michiganensis]
MTNNKLTPKNVTRYAQYGVDMMEWPDGAYVKYEDYAALSAELQERRKAAIDSEPVAWLAIYHGEVYDEAIGITRSVVEAQADHFGWESALTEIIPLYRHAQQPVTAEPDHQLCKKCNDGLRGGCSACSFSGR